MEGKAVAQDDTPTPSSYMDHRVLGLAALAAVVYTLTAMVTLVALPEPAVGVAVVVWVGFAGLVAAGCATWAAWRSPGDRRWRLLAGGALACATLPALGLTRAPSMAGDAVPGISAKNALYPLLLCHPLAMAMLLTIPTTAREDHDCLCPAAHPTGRRWRAAVVLDSLLLVGSLALLGCMVATRDPDAGPELPVVFSANTAGNLILVVTLVLLASYRKARSRTAFGLFAAGLAAYAVTKSVLTYAVVHEWRDVPPLVDIGFVAGPLLVALACLTGSRSRDGPEDQANRHAQWVHTVLPYVALGVIIILLPTRSGTDMATEALVTSLLGITLIRLLMTMTDNAQLLSRIRYQASHDSLTGLANRALFVDRLTHAVTRHTHNHQPLALLFCDIDDFKHINDCLGHAAGDELLCTVARQLTGCVRPSDTVARMGGDEFAILLDGGTADPTAVGRCILDAVRAPCTRVTPSHEVRTSVGLVIVGPDTDPVTPDALLRQADLAMYTAKERGKGALVVHRQ